MISFVWSSKYPFLAGAGGSENYTAGQVRELLRRGIAARILTIGHGEQDGRDEFPDITFQALSSKEDLSELNDTLVFVTYPLDVPTRKQPYAILHCPPPDFQHGDPLYNLKAFKGKRLIATSKFAAKMWRKALGPTSRVTTVYPFAEEEFKHVVRTKDKSNTVKILFAGRLIHDKGIYTLLAALHMENLQGLNIEVTATDSGANTQVGHIIWRLLQAHPQVQVVPARKTSSEMAELMADHDLVVVPSTNIFWQETFGIVAVEAQYAGCRVVASRSGGLPETQCGGVELIEPDNPMALARGIVRTANRGPLTAVERQEVGMRFTVQQSVDAFLDIIMTDRPRPKTVPLPKGGALFPLLQPQLVLFGGRLRQPAYPAGQHPVGKLPLR